MQTGIPSHYDAPPDGDFASYVEKITASVPAGAAKAPVSVRTSPGAAGAPRGMAAHVPAASLPPDLAGALVPLLGVLHGARMVLLLLIIAHAVSLFFLGRGSLPGLAVMAALWWALGGLTGAAPRLLASGQSTALNPQRKLHKKQKPIP